jgi:hypothetical protein
MLFAPMNAAEAADRVCDLLAKPAEEARLGRAGQERVRALRWAGSCQTLAHVVESTLAQARGRQLQSSSVRSN